MRIGFSIFFSCFFFWNWSCFSIFLLDMSVWSRLDLSDIIADDITDDSLVISFLFVNLFELPVRVIMETYRLRQLALSLWELQIPHSRIQFLCCKPIMFLLNMVWVSNLFTLNVLKQKNRWPCECILFAYDFHVCYRTVTELSERSLLSYFPQNNGQIQ